MGVPQDQRPEGSQVVDVAVAVDVEDAGAAAVGDERRVAADGLEGPDGAGDTAGHDLLSAPKKLARAMAIVSVRHQERVREPERGAGGAQIECGRGCPEGAHFWDA